MEKLRILSYKVPILHGKNIVLFESGLKVDKNISCKL